MKVVSKFVLLLTAAVAIFPGSNLMAQREVQDRAAVVIAVESVDDLLGDVSYLVGAAGFPEFVPLVTFGATEFIRGLDRSQPAGAIVSFNEQTPVVLVFVPVTDVEQVFDTLSNQGFEIEDDGDFNMLTGPNGDEAFVLEQDGWAFISNSKENLVNLPADPAEIVGEMAAKYSISAKAYVQRIPQELRQMAIDAMRDGFSNAMGDVADEGEEATLQQKYNELSINNMIEMIDDSETVMLGFEIDGEGKRNYFDFAFTAREGSKLARRIAATGAVESKLLGFLRENAAINFHMCTGMIEEDKAIYQELLQDGRQEIIDKVSEEADELSEDERKVVEDAIDSLIDVGIATIKQGKFDMAGSVTLEDGKFSMIGGSAVADGEKFSDDAVKLLKMGAKMSSDEGREVVIRENVAQAGNVTFHIATCTLTEDDDDVARRIFGDRPELVIGVSDNAYYVAAGSNGIDEIKQAIARQGSDDGHAAAGFIAVMPILKFAAEVSGDENMNRILLAMQESLEESGKDKILFQASYEGNRASSRIEIEEGLIRLIGVGVQQFQAGGMAPAAVEEVEDF